jgi:hypothetical protein
MEKGFAEVTYLIADFVPGPFRVPIMLRKPSSPLEMSGFPMDR